MDMNNMDLFQPDPNTQSMISVPMWDYTLNQNSHLSDLLLDGFSYAEVQEDFRALDQFGLASFSPHQGTPSQASDVASASTDTSKHSGRLSAFDSMISTYTTPFASDSTFFLWDIAPFTYGSDAQVTRSPSPISNYLTSPGSPDENTTAHSSSRGMYSPIDQRRGIAEGRERNGMIWGMRIEDYRALPAKERKRLRNRISARTFRTKKKRKLAAMRAQRQLTVRAFTFASTRRQRQRLPDQSGQRRIGSTKNKGGRVGREIGSVRADVDCKDNDFRVESCVDDRFFICDRSCVSFPKPMIG